MPTYDVSIPSQYYGFNSFGPSRIYTVVAETEEEAIAQIVEKTGVGALVPIITNTIKRS